MQDMNQARAQMGEQHLVGRDIRDPNVLEAFRRVPREGFVPEERAVMPEAEVSSRQSVRGRFTRTLSPTMRPPRAEST